MASSSSVVADNMQKPLLDNRSYRVIQLPNKLEALLVHDPDTDKASAAMDVNVGSFSDSDDMPGMAHAVEHLLFMGTKKYPGENDYNQYLQKFGGYSNAFTASCDTNYYFELSATSTPSNSKTSSLSSKESLSIPKSQAPLYGALDRFAQFFVHPLFLEDSLDRELQAVDSENKKNLQSDTWRLHQLNKSLSNKKHPFNKFSTGNYKVLHDEPIARGVEIRKAFIDFYKTHYSANRMKLVVLGRESLEELEGWVKELFADVPNQDLPQLRWDDIPAFSEREVETQIFAKPVMDMRNLDLHFPYPDEEELWESHPGRYISHLIGHEGPGSILAYIKAKGWANGLGAGPNTICPGTGLFSISIRLTQDGLKNYEEVVKAVLQYIAMVKEQPPLEWIVQEMKQLSEVDFKFKQKIPASRTTSHLSGVMQKPYPRDKLLSAQSLIGKFDPAAIQTGLDQMRPDNFRLTVVAQEFPGDWDQKEKWYGTEYKYEKIPAKTMAAFEEAYKAPASQRPKDLYLPGKNEFIPTKLDVEKKIVQEPAISPKLIRNDLRVRTWWKKDDQFWVPKANLNIAFRSPLAHMSALTAVLTQMFKELVQDSLGEYAYDAELAGLDYSIQNHAQGLDVSINGYNDKMHVLLEKVLLSIRDLEVKEERFDIIKDRMLRGWRNFDFQQPYQQVGTYSRFLISERGYVNQQLLDELPSVTVEDVRSFFPQLLRQMHIEILAHGNIYREDALRFTDIIESTMKARTLPESQWPVWRSIVLPQGSNYVYKRTLKDPQNVNHCIDYMLFTGLNTDRANRAKLLLFSQMADEPCFDTLRTKQQLGYVVSSSPCIMTMVCGYRVLIQSEKPPEFLEKRIDEFLVGFGDVLKSMSEQDFESYKVALINKRLEKLKNLNQETGRFWHHVTSEAFDFELVYRDVEQIEPLSKQDMIDYYTTHLHPSSPQRAKASVWLIAQTSPEKLAAQADPKEVIEKLSATLAQLLSQMQIQVDNPKLQSRLDAVDIKGHAVSQIKLALSTYLIKDNGMAQADVDKLVFESDPILAQILPQIGIVAASNDDSTSLKSDETKSALSKEAEVIENVRAFKAGMPLSAGAQPVKDLSEFEDLEPKL